MKEIGIVTSVSDNTAIVKVDKKSECDKCGMCLFPKNASSIEFRAQNALDVKVDDTVIIETKADAKMLGAVLVFLVPLLLIGLSALISYLVIKVEIWTLILSVLLIVAWFAVLSVIDKKLKKTKKFNPVVIQILKDSCEQENK